MVLEFLIKSYTFECKCTIDNCIKDMSNSNQNKNDKYRSVAETVRRSPKIKTDFQEGVSWKFKKLKVQMTRQWPLNILLSWLLAKSKNNINGFLRENIKDISRYLIKLDSKHSINFGNSPLGRVRMFSLVKFWIGILMLLNISNSLTDFWNFMLNKMKKIHYCDSYVF